MQKIASEGVKRQIRGVLFNGGICPNCETPWPVIVDHKIVGEITSAIWSPRLNVNIGLSIIDCNWWKSGQSVVVKLPENKLVSGEISYLPFK